MLKRTVTDRTGNGDLSSSEMMIFSFIFSFEKFIQFLILQIAATGYFGWNVYNECYFWLLNFKVTYGSCIPDVFNSSVESLRKDLNNCAISRTVASLNLRVATHTFIKPPLIGTPRNCSSHLSTS